MAMKFDPRIFPTIMIALSVLAAVGYLVDGGVGEWRKVVYWTAAAALTFTVTY
jgi:hypothetical protein